METAEGAQVIRCSACGTMNRVPVKRMSQRLQPVCGRCKEPLVMSVHPLVVTDASFEKVIEEALIPVLVDMWAAWCGPCRAIAPAIDQLAAELAGRVLVAKLNIDENPNTAARFGVRSIPTLLVLKEGREVDRIVGAQPKQAILGRLQAFI